MHPGVHIAAHRQGRLAHLNHLWGILISTHRSFGDRGLRGWALLCITMDTTCTWGLLCVFFLHLILLVQSTYIVGCTFVTRATTTCTLGSESQGTGKDVGLKWVTSGGILVRCHGIFGGGRLHPSFIHCFH